MLVRAGVAQLLPQFPREHREPLVLSHYLPGGYYVDHVDGRRATVLLYLTGAESLPQGGGETEFEELNVKCAPRRGCALVP